MEETYLFENSSERERLPTLIVGLSEKKLVQSLRHGWTVSVALAHLAFWDCLTLKVLEKWEGGNIPPTIGGFDAINDAMLPEWLEVAPLSAAHNAVAATEQVDR